MEEQFIGYAIIYLNNGLEETLDTVSKFFIHTVRQSASRDYLGEENLEVEFYFSLYGNSL